MTPDYRISLRPCYVKAYKHTNKRPWFEPDGERKALFHGWHIYSQIVDPSIMQGGHSGGVTSTPVALVEFEDGTVSMVPVADVRFIDNKFADYCFGEEKTDE